MDISNVVITKVPEILMISVERGVVREIPNRRTYGLTFCINGMIEYELDGKYYISDNNSAVLLPQGKTYKLHCNQSGLFPTINFCSQEMLYNNDFQVFSLAGNSTYIRLCQQLSRLCLFKSETYHIKSLGIMYEILSMIVSRQKHSNKSYQIIKPAIDYLEANYDNPLLSVEGLAEISGISVAYFRRLFSDVYGISPRKYIMDIRINKAKELLTSYHPRVSDVAVKCGFSSPFHFCHSFKSVTGLTALEYNIKYGI